jgi:capsular polysaccharide export protein
VISSLGNLLADKRQLLGDNRRGAQLRLSPTPASPRLERAVRESFLRIPPFPGAHLSQFAKVQPASFGCDELVAEMKRRRVGGSYWAAQPKLPDGYVLASSGSLLDVAKRVASGRPILLWDRASDRSASTAGVVGGECDPWHMLAKASALVAEPGDELCIIAALLDRPSFEVDGEAGEVTQTNLSAGELLIQEFSETAFENPFTGEIMDPLETVALCGFWRELIDSNRDVAGGLGFAFWKQRHVEPLLWGGSGRFKFMRNPASASAPLAVWRAKLAADAAAELERAQTRLIEVEDGFLRSRGLGADCIPPLSITVDRLGAYFDPSRPSELESLLQDGQFDATLLARARELRLLIVAAGLGKYGHGHSVLERPRGERRHILVPGQVEDDRAVIAGGCGLVSNLDLLRRVRDRAPDAYILYKPHPDVVAGHRRGAIPEGKCLEHADEIVGDLAISSLIAMVDEIHVNTSLAGFEALLRKKPVTTYGVPFYAGWGLTHDLGPVPERRRRTRTLDELVAATLLLYPRYLDPITGLPCPAEVVVSRLSAVEQRDPGLIVTMRRFQGKFMRRLRTLIQ